MQTTKWLPGLICASLLAAGGAASLQIARGVAQREALPQLSITTTTASRKASSSAQSASKPASSDIDLIVKRYYFDHTSEFAPLPSSPRERAEAFRQIKSTILQKISDVRS